MHKEIQRIVALALGLLLAQPLLAGDRLALTANGKVTELDLAALRALPATEASSAYRSSKGIEAGIYKGVLLWDLVQAQGLVTADQVKPALRHNLLVTAGDGHAVAFSIGEIAPDFGATPVLLAYEMNGAPLPDGLRMVVPGDLRGARYVKDVTGMDLR